MTGRARDEMEPLTRWLALLILPFLAVASVLLYLLPTETERLFAWTIQPPLTAMLLGSAYLGGIWFFVHVVWQGRWHRVRHGFPAVVVFASLAGVATLLHIDRFHAGHVSFVTWLRLYLTTPFLVLGVLLANRRSDDSLAEEGDFPSPFGCEPRSGRSACSRCSSDSQCSSFLRRSCRPGRGISLPWPRASSARY